MLWLALLANTRNYEYLSNCPARVGPLWRTDGQTSQHIWPHLACLDATTFCKEDHLNYHLNICSASSIPCVHFPTLKFSQASNFGFRSFGGGANLPWLSCAAVLVAKRDINIWTVPNRWRARGFGRLEVVRRTLRHFHCWERRAQAWALVRLLLLEHIKDNINWRHVLAVEDRKNPSKFTRTALRTQRGGRQGIKRQQEKWSRLGLHPKVGTKKLGLVLSDLKYLI